MFEIVLLASMAIGPVDYVVVESPVVAQEFVPIVMYSRIKTPIYQSVLGYSVMRVPVYRARTIKVIRPAPIRVINTIGPIHTFLEKTKARILGRQVLIRQF